MSESRVMRGTERERAGEMPGGRPERPALPFA